MQRYRNGDGASFEQLYARYRGPLFRYFARQAAKASVDDLFQETWLRVIRAEADYGHEAAFRAYLYRVAHNVLVDHYRRELHTARPTPTEHVDPVDPADGPEDRYEADHLRAVFVAALGALPAEQRETFLLHEEAGLTLEQIGTVVGAGRETVKSRLRYAVNRLRDALGEQFKVQEEIE